MWNKLKNFLKIEITKGVIVCSNRKTRYIMFSWHNYLITFSSIGISYYNENKNKLKIYKLRKNI